MFPKWVSPNIITLMGLMSIFFGYGLLYYYCGSTSECAAPSWVFPVVALSLLVYQTMDALDGQQGKRVGMYTNATTELFDHGCDSVCTLMGVLIFSHAANLFESPTLAFTLALSAFTIFISHTWELTITHKMRFRLVGNPTEGLFVSMGFLIITGIIGPRYWSLRLCEYLPQWMTCSGSLQVLNHIRLNALAVIIIMMSSIATATKITINLMAYTRQRNEGILARIQELIPYVFFVFFAYQWMHNGLAFKAQPRLTIFAIGMHWLQIVMYLIIAEVTSTRFQWLSALLYQFPLAIPALCAWLLPFWGDLMEKFFLYAFVCYSVTLYIRTVYHFCSEMCAVLDMPHWWSIPKNQNSRGKRT